MYKFTNHYIPNCVGGDCFTTFYEDNVDTTLVRIDGSHAPIKEWDLEHDYMYTVTDPLIDRDNMIEIIHVTKIAKTSSELKRLHYAVLNAKHLNIRLIVPRTKYPPNIRCNIDNDCYDSREITTS